MTFANPWPALVTALIAIPLLLVLYILKLRRQTMRIPSTLLWHQSFDDLQVNVPFRKLRWSLLLLLQLLLVVLLILALAEPRLEVGSSGAARMILLVDRSASMNASMDDGRTRLDAARDAARDIVERVGRGGEASEIMILSFGRSASVVSGFESNRRVLLNAIDTIESTDEQADLEAALQLAGSFASQGEDATERPPNVVLLSDGGVAITDPDDSATGYRLRGGEFRFVQIVDEEDSAEVNNVGIAAFSARRDYEDPARVLVFVRLVNAGASRVSAVASLVVDEETPLLKRVTVPAATTGDQPGEVTVTYSIDLQEGAVLHLSHNLTDDLAVDNEAWLVMPPPALPRVAIVYGQDGVDSFLEDLLQAMQPQIVEQMSAEVFESRRESMASGREYDLVVFDRVNGHALPGLPSLSIGGTPAGVDVIDASESSQRVLSWDRQHPVMRFVTLDTVVYRDFGAFDLPAGATPLAFGTDGPIIAVLHTRGARHVLVGFALTNSNWPVHVSVTVFLQNVLDYLTLAGSVQAGLVHRPGEPITVQVVEGATQLQIEGPWSRSVTLSDESTTTLPPLRQCGVYEIDGALAPLDRVAVSMLSDTESDIRPQSSVIVNATEQRAASVGETVPLDLWPWLIGVGIGLLTLEWLTYCSRLRSMS